MVEYAEMNGLFVGKELGSDGVKKDGNKWRKWTYSFKEEGKEEAQYPAKVVVFQTGKVEEGKEEVIWEELPKMEEGKWYALNIILRDYTNSYGPQKSKTLFKFTEGKKETVAVPTIDWSEFVKSYEENVKGATFRHPMHMFGIYMANYGPAKFKNIASNCVKHFQG